MSEHHWTVDAKRIGDGSANPLWGHVAEDEDGGLLLPAWRNPMRHVCPGGWWNRRLDLRRPTHWLPWLRSRVTRTLQWVERP